MISTPPEPEMVKTFISNLQPKYKEHLRYMGLDTLDKVYRIGIEIEDDLIKENKNKGPTNRKYNSYSKGNTPSNNQTSSINTVETTPP